MLNLEKPKTHLLPFFFHRAANSWSSRQRKRIISSRNEGEEMIPQKNCLEEYDFDEVNSPYSCMSSRQLQIYRRCVACLIFLSSWQSRHPSKKVKIFGKKAKEEHPPFCFIKRIFFVFPRNLVFVSTPLLLSLSPLANSQSSIVWLWKYLHIATEKRERTGFFPLQSTHSSFPTKRGEGQHWYQIESNSGDIEISELEVLGEGGREGKSQHKAPTFHPPPAYTV